MEVVVGLIPSFHFLMTGPKFYLFNHLAYIQELRKQDSERTTMLKPTAMKSTQRRDGRSTLMNELLRQSSGKPSVNASFSYKEEKGNGNKETFLLFMRCSGVCVEQLGASAVYCVASTESPWRKTTGSSRWSSESLGFLLYILPHLYGLSHFGLYCFVLFLAI